MTGRMDHTSPGDSARLVSIVAQAFGFPADAVDWVERVGTENVRVWRHEGTVDATLLLIPMGQWFGGRLVPMVGIASVAVAAEARGTGVSSGLLRAVLQELHERDTAISTLFPTTWPVYRKMGYEVAGSQFEARLKPSDIHVSCRPERLHPLTAYRANRLYGEVAPRFNGWIDRPELIWNRVLHPRHQQPFGYLAGDDGYLVGYLLRNGDEYNLHLTDLQARTAEAADRLLTLMADHRSTVQQVIWYSSGLDPTLFRLPDKNIDLRVRRHWMVRIVDVPFALQSRGYPAGLRTSLSLEVYGDNVIDSNNGRYVLQVEDGQGSVDTGGSADLRLSLRALAPLFTGFMSPWALQAAGVLQAEPHVLATAASIFSGVPPTLLDHF